MSPGPKDVCQGGQVCGRTWSFVIVRVRPAWAKTCALPKNSWANETIKRQQASFWLDDKVEPSQNLRGAIACRITVLTAP